MKDSNVLRVLRANLTVPNSSSCPPFDGTESVGPECLKAKEKEAKLCSLSVCLSSFHPGGGEWEGDLYLNVAQCDM